MTAGYVVVDVISLLKEAALHCLQRCRKQSEEEKVIAT